MPWRPSRSIAVGPPTRGVGALLAGMRIRKKLVFLHTCFSLVLAGVLALAMRPAARQVVRQAEQHEASVLRDLVMVERARHGPGSLPALRARLGPSVSILAGSAEDLGLEASDAGRIRAAGYSGGGGVAWRRDGTALAAAYDPEADEFVGVSVVLQGAREAVTHLYILLTLALLAVYALVALTLEMFVLPQHVYGPIRALLRADRALQEGRTEEELVPEAAMPADELGDIMRSRNESIGALRGHERDLAAAMWRLEEVANDLRKKNHLLEMARRNLADADRLASLGMMSAGIAHELNTPLAVLKGMVERLQGGGAPLDAEEARLMLRVVNRLERLSESLLDFARVRPHSSLSAHLRPLVDEAWTLVRLDREAASVTLENLVGESLRAWCDPDRIVQVLVNLLRNAVDAMQGAGVRNGGLRIRVDAEVFDRDGRPWVSLRIADNGPGIAPDLLGRLFQPFVSTRLDSKGTGLGLAVAEGIVREHGGMILARNRLEGSGQAVGGAEFEVVLPQSEGASESGPPRMAETEAAGPAATRG